jgi:hypothetical protein
MKAPLHTIRDETPRMTTIPQLRQDLAQEQRAKLDAIAERDVAREAVKALRDELANEKRRKPKSVRVEVPTPCPEQAKTIKALRAELAKFAKYDMTRFKKWCQMVDAARGRDA